MKILNVHKRIIHQPIHKVEELMESIASKEDKIWPYEKWPAIRFKEGLNVGNTGGHGPIRYKVVENEKRSKKFFFLKPQGFNGTHRLTIHSALMDTEIKHEINMSVTLAGTFLWYLGIKWLHDELIEDAFDKVENTFSQGN